jgi:plasmid stabilization system protein ParE
VRRATFLASVERDLVDIFTLIAEASASLSIARGYVRRLRDHCHHVAGLPGQMGRPRPLRVRRFELACAGRRYLALAMLALVVINDYTAIIE